MYKITFENFLLLYAAFIININLAFQDLFKILSYHCF